ncbi:MAG: hypothetical protein RLZ98_1402 [Pseudomonadota bacterium]|jgi:coenzyme Q-binding protein COQ10
MPAFRTQRRVPFSPKQMFDLVADVEKYPEFLPLCEALSVEQRLTSPAGHAILVARMVAGYGAIRESFKSQVTLRPEDDLIEVAYIDGPFRYLSNTWTFLDVDGDCQIDFFISYEFRSAILGIVVGKLFDTAFLKFSEAFEARAHVVYGSAQRSALLGN